MKKIAFLPVLVFFACNSNSVSNKEHLPPYKMENGCLASFELNPADRGDTINRVYGGNIKKGHWIDFEMIPRNEKLAGKAGSDLVRTKLAEGYYEDNKKEGFWKFYNKDGTLKDSLEYSHDLVVN